MKIIGVKIDNIYKFNEFEVKFTSSKPLKGLYLNDGQKEEVSNINVIPHNIIVGANASGKTTLGKCLQIVHCALRDVKIDNLIKGAYIENPGKTSYIEVEFVKAMDGSYVPFGDGKAKKDIFFRYRIVFDRHGIESEKVEYYYLTSKQSYNAAKYKTILETEKLFTENEPVILYYSTLKDSLSSLDEVGKFVIDTIKTVGYSFRFSGKNKENINIDFPNAKLETKEEFVSYLEFALKMIDNGIESCKLGEIHYLDDNSLSSDDEIEFVVKFVNGSSFTANTGNHSSFSEKLSTGTTEALVYLINYFNYIGGKYSTIYVDEQLSHSHFELEKELLLLMVVGLPKSGQNFMTTHNLELLKVNLPIQCYKIMYRDDDGYNKVISPDTYFVNKSDRNLLYNKISNDYFGIIGDFESDGIIDRLSKIWRKTNEK